MPAYSLTEIHTLRTGQAIVRLTHPYQIGVTTEAQLKIYKNDLLLVRDVDYTETDNFTITMAIPLRVDDLLITENPGYVSVRAKAIIADSPRALFPQFGTENRLQNNQRYTLSFHYNGEPRSITFLSAFNPMYSSVSIIRMDLSDIISKIPDARIATMIYLNSVQADLMFTTEFEDAEDGVVPNAAKQYVRYKTGLDIMLAIYLHMSARGDGDHFVLGALEVEKKYNLADIRPLLSELKAKVAKYARNTSPLTTAVMAGNNAAYPLTSPRRGE